MLSVFTIKTESPKNVIHVIVACDINVLNIHLLSAYYVVCKVVGIWNASSKKAC